MSIALAVAAAPDGDPAPSPDLPATVATDRRGALIEAKDGRPVWRPQDHQRGERLGELVVVRERGGIGDDPERPFVAEREMRRPAEQPARTPPRSWTSCAAAQTALPDRERRR